MKNIIETLIIFFIFVLGTSWILCLNDNINKNKEEIAVLEATVLELSEQVTEQNNATAKAVQYCDNVVNCIINNKW